MTAHSKKEPLNPTLWFGSLLCGLGALFYCYEFVLRIIPGILQSELRHVFGNLSASAFGTLSAFYYFAYSPMQIPVGVLMDRFGPRKLLTFACLACTLGSYLFAQTWSFELAALGRFLVGFGSSFAFVGVLSLTLQWMPRRFFSLIAGLITTVSMLCLVYGEVKLTHLSDSLGLHTVLMGSVWIGLLLTGIIFTFVRDGTQNVTPYDKGQWMDFFTDVWHVLSSRHVWLIGIIGACMYTSLSIFGELWGKMYLEQAHHLTKSQAASGIAALFLGWAVGAPLMGHISDQNQRWRYGLILGALGGLLCVSALLYVPNLSYPWILSLMFFYGVFTATEIIVFIIAKEISGAKLSGTVFAVTNMIVTLGGVIFQPTVGKLLDLASHTTLTHGLDKTYAASDYQIALAVLPLALLGVIIMTYCFPEKKPHP